MGEPRDYQLRIYYRLDGERYYDDFWTTKTIFDGLTEHHPDSNEFEKALKKLNPLLRYRQGYGAKDWAHEIKPHHILDKPQLVGIKISDHPNQERLFGRGCSKKAIYLKAPLGVERKKKPESEQGNLFDNYKTG